MAPSGLQMEEEEQQVPEGKDAATHSSEVVVDDVGDEGVSPEEGSWYNN